MKSARQLLSMRCRKQPRGAPALRQNKSNLQSMVKQTIRHVPHHALRCVYQSLVHFPGWQMSHNRGQSLDFGTVNDNPNGASGYFRGRQRMLHASGPSGYSLTLNVTSSAWYSGGDNWRTVGSVVDDTECKTKTGDPGWRGFHVHQDFMPPETSVESCQWNMNTSTDFHTGVTDRRRDDPDIWYIYSVSYVPGTPCLNPGPKVADKLLAPDGALDGDGNGAGTRALATGAQSSVTSPQTCITGTSWCGTITATPPVVVGAYNY